MKKEEAKQWLENILPLIPVTYTEIKLEEVGAETSIISIDTPDSALLIGTNGETLQALNHLVKRFCEKGSDEKGENIIVDINGYRKKNDERLKKIAAMLGERARGFRHEVAMDPMSAYERRVVHSFFQDDPELMTESRGFGRARYIVIKYTESKNLATPVPTKEEETF